MRKVGGTSIGVVLGLVVVASGLLFVYAQAPGGGGPGGGGGGGMGRGDFTPERMQQMMLDRVKEGLKPTDEEWKVIEPLVGPVVEKRREMQMSSFRGMGRMGRRPEAEANVDPAVKGLEDALASAETPAKDVEAKLKALRDSRKAKEEELKKLRTKLREVLSIRQEARLVLMDILD
jgi:hypothetical protein